MVNAPGCGSGIRGFKSPHPPHTKKVALEAEFRCFVIFTISLLYIVGVYSAALQFSNNRIRVPDQDRVQAEPGGSFLAAR